MARGFVVALVALVGLVCAAGIGYAAYAVSRDSVAVPVTRASAQANGARTDACSAEAAASRPKHGEGDVLYPDD